MKRSIYNQLLEWKDSPRRKPLMLYGARQVGKTYILKEFGRKEYEKMVYINCYKNQAVETLFAADMDVARILIGLSALSGEEIIEGKTLIFLDEVQEIPDVVASLKYFCEDVPGLAVATAGSLLGVMNMKDKSFPTGKVDIIHMFPMTFIEFIEALGEDKMAELLNSPENEDLTNTLMTKYVDMLRMYYFVGGMPEAVAEFARTRTPEYVRKIQEDILAAYDADIAKHAGNETQKVRLVFQSIPAQLAKENKKFIFGALKKGSRASEYENAIQWLVDAELVYKTPRLSKVELPLKFYTEMTGFKLFLLDVGLLGALVQAPPALMLIGNNVFTEYKGAFTENYALTQMVGVPNVVIGYYSKENSTMELDFVVQAGNKLIPLEVKAEENVKSRSLRQFVTVDKADSHIQGVRFSMKGFIHHDWMTNVPLFAIHSWLTRTAEE